MSMRDLGIGAVVSALLLMGVAAMAEPAVTAAGTAAPPVKVEAPPVPAAALAPLVITASGIVHVNTDANNVVKYVSIVDAKARKKYSILLDEKGRKVAELKGQAVTARGIIKVENGRKMLVVQEFGPAEETREQRSR
jgi:hypothetical protein